MDIYPATSQASLYKNTLKLGVNLATFLAKNDRRIYVLCVAVILGTYIFSSCSQHTTQGFEDATTLHLQGSEYEGKPARAIYRRDPRDTRIPILQGNATDNSIIAGDVIPSDIVYTEEEVTHNRFELAEKNLEGKYIYYDTSSNQFAYLDEPSKEKKYLKAYFRDSALTGQVKYAEFNLIYPGKRKAGNYTKDQLENGYVKRQQGKGYYADRNGPSMDHSEAALNNIIEENDPLRWDEKLVAPYTRHVVQTEVNNSWSEWTKRENHPLLVQSFFTKAESFSLQHSKALYVGSIVLGLVTFGSTFMIQKT